jgi:hypothetical protein
VIHSGGLRHSQPAEAGHPRRRPSALIPIYLHVPGPGEEEAGSVDPYDVMAAAAEPVEMSLAPPRPPMSALSVIAREHVKLERPHGNFSNQIQRGRAEKSRAVRVSLWRW